MSRRGRARPDQRNPVAAVVVCNYFLWSFGSSRRLFSAVTGKAGVSTLSLCDLCNRLMAGIEAVNEHRLGGRGECGNDHGHLGPWGGALVAGFDDQMPGMECLPYMVSYSHPGSADHHLAAYIRASVRRLSPDGVRYIFDSCSRKLRAFVVCLRRVRRRSCLATRKGNVCFGTRS